MPRCHGDALAAEVVQHLQLRSEHGAAADVTAAEDAIALAVHAAQLRGDLAVDAVELVGLTADHTLVLLAPRSDSAAGATSGVALRGGLLPVGDPCAVGYPDPADLSVTQGLGVSTFTLALKLLHPLSGEEVHQRLCDHVGHEAAEGDTSGVGQEGLERRPEVLEGPPARAVQLAREPDLGSAAVGQAAVDSGREHEER